MSIANQRKWYQHVNKLQQTLNSTFHRSIGMTPFRLLTEVPMRYHEDVELKEILETEWQQQFEDSRNDLRHQAKLQIWKI